jgi:hypothetical protein
MERIMKITNKSLLSELEISRSSNGMTKSLCTMLLAMIDNYIAKKESEYRKKLPNTIRINLINIVDRNYSNFNSNISKNPYAYFYSLLNKELSQIKF